MVIGYLKAGMERMKSIFSQSYLRFKFVKENSSFSQYWISGNILPFLKRFAVLNVYFVGGFSCSFLYCLSRIFQKN